MPTNSTYPLRNVFSRYGAPMGRPNTLPDDRDSPILLALVRARMIRVLIYTATEEAIDASGMPI
jgi:hypothetical protein